MIPEFLINMLINQYGNEQTNKIIEGYKTKRINSLRINTSLTTKEEIISILKKENIKFEEVSWYNDALIINENINDLDIYKEGKIYMQSLSSMIPPIILSPENEKILDMAASPGGKTTQIYNLSNKEAIITAVEKNKIRSERW